MKPILGFLHGGFRWSRDTPSVASTSLHSQEETMLSIIAVAQLAASVTVTILAASCLFAAAKNSNP
jgi:hypothetical protein